MRIALLSTDTADAAASGPGSGFALFAGLMLIERQLDLAVSLGCERAICLADTIGCEVIRLQQRAESAGVKFRAVRGASRLAGMINPDDELLAIAPGILADNDAVRAGLDRKAVLGLPADLAVPLGYERIDMHLAWAGIMLVQGSIIEHLSSLPEDVDIMSSLMRLSLQSGTPAVSLDRTLLADGHWHLNPDRATLDMREKRWIDAQRRQITFRAPGLALAEHAGARLARDVLGRAGQAAPAAGAALLTMGAIVAGAVAHPAIGLALLTCAALLSRMGEVVNRVARHVVQDAGRNPLLVVLQYMIDPVLVILLILAAPAQLALLSMFVPLMLVGLLRLGEEHSNERWRATYADRISLCAVLALAGVFGYATHAAAAIALIALGSRFLKPFREG